MGPRRVGRGRDSGCFHRRLKVTLGSTEGTKANIQDLGLHTWTWVLLSSEIGKVRTPGRKPNSLFLKTCLSKKSCLSLASPLPSHVLFMLCLSTHQFAGNGHCFFCISIPLLGPEGNVMGRHGLTTVKSYQATPYSLSLSPHSQSVVCLLRLKVITITFWLADTAHCWLTFIFTHQTVPISMFFPHIMSFFISHYC